MLYTNRFTSGEVGKPCKNTFEALISNQELEANNKLCGVGIDLPSPIINALCESLATLN